MSLAFLLTCFAVVASPGTGVLVTLSAGLSRGTTAAIAAAFGCTLGIVPYMLATVTGLAALLHASAVAFQFVKYAGAAYLLYMAWTTLREHGTLQVGPDEAGRSNGAVIVSAVLVNLLNPKLSIFFVAFLPQFVPADAPHPLAAMLTLSGVFMFMTFVVFVAYGVFAAAARRHVLSRPRVLTWLRRTFAMAFLGLGARLALSDR